MSSSIGMQCSVSGMVLFWQLLEFGPHCALYIQLLGSLVYDKIWQLYNHITNGIGLVHVDVCNKL